MMKPTLVIGNDINNVNNDVSWSGLLSDLIKDVNGSLPDSEKIGEENFEQKPFPLLYEEIYMKALQSQDKSELQLKEEIAKMVGKIKRNEIHERVSSGKYQNLLTTNYEHSLDPTDAAKKHTHTNLGLIKETKFNIFRHHQLNDINYWHIHGDGHAPNSIVLGYEHYSGQLQQMRNYVISGTTYTSKKAKLKPLVNRLGRDDFKLESWVDLFFCSDVHIIGLSCDYIESDLWWLFTIRARRILEKSQFARKYPHFLRVAINSRIVYYYPRQYYNQEKDQLMRANGIETVAIDEADKLNYYNKILDGIESEYRL